MTTLERPVEPMGRFLGRPVPFEGEDGLYRQSWYPVCWSSELARGKAVGADFLGGRVVAFRGAGGVPRVFSAYCVHLGADLAVGKVLDDGIRCAFHGWEYGSDGVCVATGIGDEVPPRARVYRFPTAERFGIVWAFNGETPLFELPDLPYPEHELVMGFNRFGDLAMEPWMISAHTFDLQHLSLSHKLRLEVDPDETVRHDGLVMGYDLVATMANGQRYDVKIDIFGPNVFRQMGTLDGRWYFWITGPSLPRTGQTNAYYVWGVRPEPGEDPEETQRALDHVLNTQMVFYADDSEVFDTIHFKPGLLTRADRTIARFLETMRTYPRANPAGDFLV